MAGNPQSDDTSIYELRFYDVASGRLAPEVARMFDVAIAGEPEVAGGPPRRARSMFDRYGIPRPLGAWIGIAGGREPQFGYIMRWESLAQRDAAFPAFWSDPLWLKIRAQTDEGVSLVERCDDWLMRPSASWDAVLPLCQGPLPDPQLTEMLIQRVETGLAAEASKAHAEGLLPKLAGQGAKVLGVFDVVIGPDMPAVVTFLAWPHQAAQEAGWAALDVDDDLSRRRQDERRRFGRELVRTQEHQLLKPVGYGVPAIMFGRAAA